MWETVWSWLDLKTVRTLLLTSQTKLHGQHKEKREKLREKNNILEWDWLHCKIKVIKVWHQHYTIQYGSNWLAKHTAAQQWSLCLMLLNLRQTKIWRRPFENIMQAFLVNTLVFESMTKPVIGMKESSHHCRKIIFILQQSRLHSDELLIRRLKEFTSWGTSN